MTKIKNKKMVMFYVFLVLIFLNLCFGNIKVKAHSLVQNSINTDIFDEDVANIPDITDENVLKKYQKEEKNREKNGDKKTETPVPLDITGEYFFSFDKDDVVLNNEFSVSEKDSETDNNQEAERLAIQDKKQDEAEIPKKRLVAGKMFLYWDFDRSGQKIIKGKLILFNQSSAYSFEIYNNYARRIVAKNAIWGVFKRDLQSGEPIWPDKTLFKNETIFIDQIRIYPYKKGFLQGEFYSINAGEARQSAFTAVNSLTFSVSDGD